MRRPLSYSDSFLVLGTSDMMLTPILVPTTPRPTIQIPPIPVPEEEIPTFRPSRNRNVLCFLFAFKGSFHILLISAFETLFYFLYVNKSENAGILTTINTYYTPLVNDCQTKWGNGTKWLLREILEHELNVTAIDAAGRQDAAFRAAYNHSLLVWSSMY